MASARFQIVSIARPVARGAAGRSTARRFTWRFLAANNRSLAATTAVFTDVDACLADLLALQRGLPGAASEYTRDATGKWRWAVRVAETGAASTHGYARQLRARTTCATFLTLVAQVDARGGVQVVYR